MIDDKNKKPADSYRQEGGKLLTVLMASYLEEEHVESIKAVDERLRVLYREDLVPSPRWPGDHVGPPGWRRTPEGEKEFLAMLEEAEVLYDFPRGHVKDLVRSPRSYAGCKPAWPEQGR